MNVQCFECESTSVIKKGTIELSNGTIKQRFKCKDCGAPFSVDLECCEDEDVMLTDDFQHEQTTFERSQDWIDEHIKQKKRIVVTAAQNATMVHSEFWLALKSYVHSMDAALIVIPIKHKTITAQDDLFASSYDERLEPYLCENVIEFTEQNLKIYGNLKIQATAENPLAGLDPLSKGHSLIVGHAQVQLKTLPNIDRRIADVICTTGAITVKNYSKTKLGEKAKFNHSYSALILELDGPYYHIRHLNYSEESKSFWDVNTEYRADGTISEGTAEALVTGDEHIMWRDSGVEKWTYTDDSSMLNVLKPKHLVRHDSLDCYSVSHHHRHSIFTQYAKWKSGSNSIEDEIKQVVDYVNQTTPSWCKSLIVQSNHNEHLLRWLNEVDIKQEPWNARLYHFLMYQMLSETKMGDNGAEYPDPFKLVAEPWLNNNVTFVSRMGYKIMDIEVGAHGDVGVNGARGSARSFARIPDKMIVGHSHSPAIEKGCYVVGTSSKLSLEYNRGASTWSHAHVVIHANGKRQMLFITPNGWKL
jgi:hypothetical protein